MLEEAIQDFLRYLHELIVRLFELGKILLGLSWVLILKDRIYSHVIFKEP